MQEPPNHVFISYSRQDEELAHALKRDLDSAGIETWIDRKGIPPGTPDWEKTIRDALSRSLAVVLIATPSSRESVPVYGELNLAQNAELPVIPLLAKGDWIDSIRISMYTAQYIDVREGKYLNGLQQLINRLADIAQEKIPSLFISGKHVESTYEKGEASDISRLWSKHTLFVLPDNRRLFWRNAASQPLATLLFELYMNHLKDSVNPYSYGTEWILVQSQSGMSDPVSGEFWTNWMYVIRRIVIYWSWLAERQQQQPLYPDDIEKWQMKTSLQNMIIPDTPAPHVWHVVTQPSKLDVSGIAFKGYTPALADLTTILGTPMMEALPNGPRQRSNIVKKSIDPDKLNPAEYEFVGIFDMTPLQGKGDIPADQREPRTKAIEYYRQTSNE